MQSFRNRLLIERDSKQRRVMSNFGLTFRNSKWASYTQNNLNSRLGSTWRANTPVTVVLLFSTFTIILMQTLTNTGVTEYTFIGSLLDSIVEASLTSVEHFAIVFFITSSTLINTLYTKTFTMLFNTESKPNNSNTINPTLDYVRSSKEVSKLLFTAKLKSLNTASTSQTMSNIFAPQEVTLEILNTSLTAHQLYKAVGYCTDTNLQPNTVTKLCNKPLLLTKSSLLANRWSLSTLNNEAVSRNVSTCTGLYSMNNYSFRQLTKLSTSQPELRNLSTLYSNYINIARTDRWLYRYSMLHRKSLRKAHDLTLAKRLTSLGFFSESLASNNLWASIFIENTSNLQSTLSNLYTSLYGNIWQGNTLGYHNESSTNSNPLTSLEFFETSYFWVLKRFYVTNNLNTHTTSSNIQPNMTTNLTKLHVTTNLQTQQSKLLRLNLEDKIIFLTSTYVKSDSRNDVLCAETTQFSRDLVTTYLENGVLENDNLDIMVWVHDDKLSNNFSYNFFNYNQYSNNPTTQLNTTFLNNNNITGLQCSTLQTYLNFTKIV